jgi:hypothetical protein
VPGYDRPVPTGRAVPYGTVLSGGVIPGTSCQATIDLSLRDGHPYGTGIQRGVLGKESETLEP